MGKTELIIFLFCSLAAFAENQLGWMDKLEFVRPGAAYDSNGRELPVNTPVRINGGIRLMDGAELTDKARNINLIPKGQDSMSGFSGEKTVSVPLPPPSKPNRYTVMFEVKGSGVLHCRIGNIRKKIDLNDDFQPIFLDKVVFPAKAKTAELLFTADGKAELRKLFLAAVRDFKSGGAWVPPGAQHCTEHFVIPPEIRQLFPDDAFEFTLEFEITRPGARNVIFEQTTIDRWWPILQFRYGHSGLELTRYDEKTKKEVVVRLKEKLKPGKRYIAVIRRQGNTAEAVINGKKLPLLTGIKPGFVAKIRIGGGGPGCSLNGILHRVSGKPFQDQAILPRSYIRHLARSREFYPFEFAVKGGTELVWQVGSQTFRGKVENGKVTVPARFPLKPGPVRQTLRLFDGEREIASLTFPAEITPAVRPENELQISPWWQFVPGKGFTYGCSNDIGTVMKSGLKWGPVQWRYGGIPRRNHPEDKYGGLIHFSHSPYMQAQMEARIARDVKNLSFYPALGAVDVNNEMTWNYRQLDLCPEAKKEAMEKFGLDLSKYKTVLPQGRLVTDLAPADGIVPDNDPLYRWHLARKSIYGETEVYLNSRMMKAFRKARPDADTVYAPLLRSAPIRSYGNELTVAQHWCYRFGLDSVHFQEGLNAMIRGRETASSSFPAFLAYPTGNGKEKTLPTADIFRASCWASLLHPTRMLVFFQAKEMFMSRKPAGLAPAVERILKQEIPPFAPLFPAWKNRPRKIAFYRSFANLLYQKERWPDDTPYLRLLNVCGTPYDILYDEDFLNDPACAERYDFIFAPELKFCLQSARSQLTAFAQKKGKYLWVTDDGLSFTGSGVRVMKKFASGASIRKQIAAAQRKFGNDPNDPRLIEAINDISRQQSGSMRKEVYAVGPEAYSHFNDSYFNALTLDQTQFLAVVNDLRTWGPLFGRFRKVREKGVLQKNTIEFDSALGSFAYDLMESREIPVRKKSGSKSDITLTLSGGSAKIIALTKSKIGKLTGTVRKGSGMIEVSAEIEGAPSIPGWITIKDVPDFSGPVLFRGGTLRYRYPDDGTPVEITLSERATGQTIKLK